MLEIQTCDVELHYDIALETGWIIGHPLDTLEFILVAIIRADPEQCQPPFFGGLETSVIHDELNLPSIDQPSECGRCRRDPRVRFLLAEGEHGIPNAREQDQSSHDAQRRAT